MTTFYGFNHSCHSQMVFCPSNIEVDFCIFSIRLKSIAFFLC